MSETTDSIAIIASQNNTPFKKTKPKKQVLKFLTDVDVPRKFNMSDMFISE